MLLGCCPLWPQPTCSDIQLAILCCHYAGSCLLLAPFLKQSLLLTVL
jgi:hypothetical protein